MSNLLRMLGISLIALCLPKVVLAQWTFNAGYNVLDVANDNTGGITGLTGNYGNTTGLERGK